MLVCALESLFAGFGRADAYFVVASWTNPSALSVQDGKDVVSKHVFAVLILGGANDSERLGLNLFFFHNDECKAAAKLLIFFRIKEL